ncbi:MULTISPECIES: aspartyl-phosphate phosphatase Spo0E family protein [Paenibacillus]|uniref:aspartyl-phosphate phosphatase Spo0E family protein n=1 Tax=Paenibacillus TaxID=44249 RepID=UPI0022B8BCA8|nr:aspartyl-phosphate phosphatase Spo0E family protein [Paenibacillus caseinilyticus]
MLLIPGSLDLQASLSREIEKLREQLVTLGIRFGLMHPEVQQCSRQLDELLLQYYDIAGLRKDKPS